MPETYGDYLRRKLSEKGVKPAELARRSGLTKQNLSRILNNTPHWQTGVLPKPSVEFVDKTARALDLDINEARLAAGYAPKEPQTRIQKLMAALEAQGVEGMDMFGGFDQLANMTDEQYDELVKSILMLVEISVRRNNDDPRGK